MLNTWASHFIEAKAAASAAKAFAVLLSSRRSEMFAALGAPNEIFDFGNSSGHCAFELCNGDGTLRRPRFASLRRDDCPERAATNRHCDETCDGSHKRSAFAGRPG